MSIARSAAAAAEGYLQQCANYANAGAVQWDQKRLFVLPLLRGERWGYEKGGESRGGEVGAEVTEELKRRTL